MRDDTKIRLLALVPHRDARLPLRKWSASLFAAGVPGAWSFPWVVPLAGLNRPLSGEELKSLARALRQYIDNESGKLTAGPPALSDLSPAISVFGPSLQTELPADFFTALDEAVNCRISPLVIGTALIYPVNFNHGVTRSYTEEEKISSLNLRGTLCPPWLKYSIDNLPTPPPISFRAAALANMIYGETNDYLCEWKIGPLQWLPKK